MSVIVTETAAREINNIIKQQELDAEKIRLRVGVKGGGCSGFSYLLDLTETQKDTDELWEFTFTTPARKSGSGGGVAASAANGSDQGNVAVAQAPASESFTIRVICDPKSYLYLNGTTIDFKDEIMGRGFVFNNPNATSSCGCGSSFSA
jgi:iron-sulfur cluster assembly protein